MLGTALERLLDLLLPPRCGGCGRTAGQGLCPACVARLPALALPARRCATCADPLAARAGRRCAACRRAPPAFDGVVAVGRYAAPLAPAIRALKYHRRAAVGDALGRLLAAAAPPLDAQQSVVVVPIPCHRARLRARGIDHAACIAQALARARRLPCLAALARVRPTAPQVGRSAAARRANVAGAFALRQPVDGAHVWLVDDVVTTGATADAAARALVSAGARRVTVLAVARAVGTAVAGDASPAYNPDSPANKEG